MKKIIGIFVLLLFASNLTFAINWEDIDEFTFIDTDSIKYYFNNYGKKDYFKYTFVTKQIGDEDTIWKENESIIKAIGENQKPAYVHYRNIIDCKQKTIATRGFMTFAQSGEVLNVAEIKETELKWNNILPDTNEALLYTNICKATKNIKY